MKIKKTRLFLLLAALAFVLIGCTDSSSINKDGNATEPTKQDVEPSSTGGDLHVAFNTQPPSLDPHMSTATATRDAARPIFETLVALNSNYEVKPLLAERFEQSDDGLEFTFYLREGIQFHNGKEMKSEDVVASLERWIGKASRAKNALGEGEFEAINDYTVKLTLPEPSVGALHVLGSLNQYGAIMPKEVIDNATETGITEYIGTGPFKFVEWKADQYIHYEKYEDYQSPEGAPDGLAGKREALVDNLYINFVVDNSTRVAAMTTGEYDIGISMPEDNFEQLKSVDSLKYEIALSAGNSFVFNNKEGIFANPAMRQAFNMALDYEEIMQGAFRTPEFYRLSPGIMFPEQKDWYTDAGKENYNPNDPERAKEMFKEAGYNGEVIRILTSRDYEFIYNTAIVIQAQLEKIGVKIELNVVDFPTMNNLMEDSSGWDALTFSYSTVTDPTQHLVFAPKNPGWNEDEKTAELIAEIRTSATPSAAYPYWEELQEHTWTTNLPYIRLGDYSVLYSYNEDVVGFNQFEGIILWNVGKK